MGNRRARARRQRQPVSSDVGETISRQQADDARTILEMMRHGDAVGLNNLAERLSQAGHYEVVTGVLIRALYVALEASAGSELDAAALAHRGINAMERAQP